MTPSRPHPCHPAQRAAATKVTHSAPEPPFPPPQTHLQDSLPLTTTHFNAVNRQQLATLLAVPIYAWIGVIAVDSLRGRTYDPDALMDTTRTSRYWYTGGFHLPAVLGWTAAIVAGLLFTKASTSDTDVWFAGSLSDTWFGVNGLGWAISMAVGAVVYALFDRRTSTAAGTGNEPAFPTLQEAGQ
ncbi:cytosine permease [Streptomyces sp. NBC_01594]|uniref:cytosine permease n=1 Tax=Streptomyces sp. NBC_01594 TaxID=2975890 RepID=UPI00386F1D1A